MKFRKKPVVIEAMEFTEESAVKVADWCGGSLEGRILPPDEWVIAIETLEGVMEAKIGDWIIKGLVGEFYPCKSYIFEATYEKAD